MQGLETDRRVAREIHDGLVAEHADEMRAPDTGTAREACCRKPEPPIDVVAYAALLYKAQRGMD